MEARFRVVRPVRPDGSRRAARGEPGGCRTPLFGAMLTLPPRPRSVSPSNLPETMDASGDDAQLRERANALYWDSDESVNQIAEDVGVSKGTLYNLVDPLAAGVPCPRCATEMEYPNRTARQKGLLVCPACGLEAEEEEVRDGRRGGGKRGGGAVIVTPGSRGSGRSEGSGGPGEGLDERERLVIGTALLGAAAGLALALWLRRK